MSKLAIHGGAPVRTKDFAEWPIFDQLEEKLLLQALRSGKWGGTGQAKSPEFNNLIEQFEREFAELHQAKYAVSCVNGTIAITAALQAADVKPGDEVIMPPYTFIATASAALAYGAIPVFVDIEENTLQIDPDAVERAITPRTKAIVAVHIAGAPARMDRLLDIASRHDLRLIEDSAQAVGASFAGRPVGAIGDVGTFSFQSSKNLNCGEGGVIVTNDPEIWEKAWSVCNVGRIPNGAWYQHERIGQNYRLTELQAAILLAQMTRLEQQMAVREKNAALLDQLLSRNDAFRVVQATEGTTRHAYHLYMLRIAPDAADYIEKNDFIRKMNAEGIPISYGYVPLHQNSAILDSIEQWTGERREYSCPVCERLCQREALWLHQTVMLGDEQAMHDIADALDKVASSYR